mgnify:CR=1 FL=1
MTKEELAARLHGRAMMKEITPEEEARALSSGLVVVFGYSDDNVEFRGAIQDEIGCYSGGEVVLCEDGSVFHGWDQVDHTSEDAAEEYFERKQMRHTTLKCLWCDGGAEACGYSWTYQIDVPHASFDILEEGRPFCRGIVFEIADLGGVPASKADPATAQETGA